MSANTSQEINVRVTDASVRECVMYANLHGRGEDTNQIGTALSVQISSAFDAWILAHDAELTEKVRKATIEEAADATTGVYEVEAGYIHDGWGATSGDIDAHYARTIRALPTERKD